MRLPWARARPHDARPAPLEREAPASQPRRASVPASVQVQVESHANAEDVEGLRRLLGSRAVVPALDPDGAVTVTQSLPHPETEAHERGRLAVAVRARGREAYSGGQVG